MAINKSNYSNSQEPKKTFQEKKDARRKERLARATAKADERLGITGQIPAYESFKPSNEITEADVNAPAFVPSATEYIDATGPTQKSTVENRFSPIVNVLANTPTSTSGTEIFDEATKSNSSTLSDIQKLAKLSANLGTEKKKVEDEEKVAVENELDKVRTQVNPQAPSSPMLKAMLSIATGMPAQQPLAPTVDNETVGLGSEDDTESINNEETDATSGGGGGDASTQGSPAGISVISGGAPSRPPYEATVTKDEVKKDVTGAPKSSQEDFYYPEPELEKLDVHDYYPEVGKSIAVGNWTGSVLGSQTIYTGAGTLLPMGLYDARKRALSKAAKDRQAFVDKLYELPSAPDQFNKKYQDHGYKMLQDDFQKYGSYEAMAKDPAWRRKMAEFRNTGVELTYADAQADALLKSVAEGNWAPKKAREAAYRLRDGVVNNFEDVMSNKSSVLKDVNILKSYSNGVDFIDEKVKEGIFKPENMSQMPINLKTGKGIDLNKFNAEKDDFLFKVRNNDPSLRDHEVYARGVVKFFDIPMVEQMIDARIATGNYDPETRDDLIEYAVAQIPKQVILEYEKFANKDVERMAEANKQKRWATDREDRLKEQMAHYDMELELMNSKGEDGETFADKVRKIKSNKKLTPQQTAVEIAKAAQEWGGRDTQRDPHTRAQVFKQSVPEYMQNKPLNSKPSSAKIKVFVPKTKEVIKNGKKTYVPLKGSDGKPIYVPTSMSLYELSRKDDGFVLDANKKPINKEGLNAVREALKSDAIWLYPQEQETYMVADNGKGGAETVTNFNINKLNLNNSGFAISTKGKATTAGKVKIENGEEIREPGLELPAGIYTEDLLNDEARRDAMNRNWGPPVKLRNYKQFGGYNTTSTSSSQSEYY